MLVPSWPAYRKVDSQKELKESYRVNGPATELLDDIFGPHFFAIEGAGNILLRYLPEYLQDILEYKAITSTESTELTTLQYEIGQSLENDFVRTSDAGAIKRREDMLGIRADPTTDSLEFRKQRILNRYQMHPPFTRRWLQRQLDRLVGAGMTVVSVDYENRALFITANIDDANVFAEVVHTVETVKPANMVYQHRTSVKDVIGLEERITKQDITWNYKLDGSWKLGEKPFASLGTEEVVK